jgi:enolase
MILPVGASSFKEAMKMGVEVYHHLKVKIFLHIKFRTFYLSLFSICDVYFMF